MWGEDYEDIVVVVLVWLFVVLVVLLIVVVLLAVVVLFVVEALEFVVVVPVILLESVIIVLLSITITLVLVFLPPRDIIVRPIVPNLSFTNCHIINWHYTPFSTLNLPHQSPNVYGGTYPVFITSPCVAGLPITIFLAGIPRFTSSWMEVPENVPVAFKNNSS